MYPIDFPIKDIFCLPSTIENESYSTQQTTTNADMVETSYSIQLNKNTNYHICHKSYNEEQKETLKYLIENEYRMQLTADGIPIGFLIDDDEEIPKYLYNFNIGYAEDQMQQNGVIAKTHYLNLFLNLTFIVHRNVKVLLYQYHTILKLMEMI